MQQRREALTWHDVDQLIDHLLPQFDFTFDGMIMISRWRDRTWRNAG